MLIETFLFQDGTLEVNGEKLINADVQFDVSDIVTFQKWLLGAYDTALADWQSANFYNDDVLDSFDLILMKQTLIVHNISAYVEPVKRV